MQQRAFDAAGDFTFGLRIPFLSNSPACVAQAVMSRLRLMAGEWFLDSLEGTRYNDLILGYDTAGSRDLAVRTRILDTPGVLRIREYISFLDATRAFVVIATIDTIYGSTAVSSTIATPQ